MRLSPSADIIQCSRSITVDRSGESISYMLAPVGTSCGSGVRNDAKASNVQIGAIGLRTLKSTIWPPIDSQVGNASKKDLSGVFPWGMSILKYFFLGGKVHLCGNSFETGHLGTSLCFEANDLNNCK